MQSNQKNPVLSETLKIVVGELVVSALIVLGYLIVDFLGWYGFTYKVITGALLGSAVTVANFFFLALTTDRAALRAMQARGNGEMSEEEIQKFTEEQQSIMNNTVKLSFTVRTVSMLAALILAFLLPWFEGLATLFPLLALRPILMVSEYFRRKE